MNELPGKIAILGLAALLIWATACGGGTKTEGDTETDVGEDADAIDTLTDESDDPGTEILSKVVFEPFVSAPIS